MRDGSSGVGTDILEDRAEDRKLESKSGDKKRPGQSLKCYIAEI